jgi:flavin-dependent dehydrogenase
VTPDRDAVVIGAGPAGSAAAAALARGGRRVLLLEKDRFPREKVCGDFLSAAARRALERLGALQEIRTGAEPIERGSIHLPGAPAVRFALARPGLGVSRRRLDALLAERAERLGAEVRCGVRVVAAGESSEDGLRVRWEEEGTERTATASAIVGAWGRWDALDRRLGREVSGGRKFLGWSRDYEDPERSLAGDVRLYVFPGGYCGLSPVEGGLAHLAGVVSEATWRRLSSGWEAVVAHARAENSDLDAALASLGRGSGGFFGTGPVFFARRPPAEGRILMVGDAAGMLDPFSGEGVASALDSGLLAAETVEDALSSRIALDGAAREYARRWRRRFGRRFEWSAAFRRLMLHPGMGAVAARLAGRGVLRLAMLRLGSGLET